jgi:sugar lactone lactonase YvrE
LALGNYTANRTGLLLVDPYNDLLSDGGKLWPQANCTGPGGVWVIAPDGTRLGTIRWPEQAVNFAFGGSDLQTLLCCAHTSVYTLRVKVPGNPRPWYKSRGQ